MRVGFWRILEALNATATEGDLRAQRRGGRVYARPASAALDAGWEFMGHGFVQRPMHKVEDQAAAIADTIEAIRTFTGKPPRGWETPGAHRDRRDARPSGRGRHRVRRRLGARRPAGQLCTPRPAECVVPYTVEINDVVMSAVQQQPSDEIWRRGRDTFDRL